MQKLYKSQRSDSYYKYKNIKDLINIPDIRNKLSSEFLLIS